MDPTNTKDTVPNEKSCSWQGSPSRTPSSANMNQAAEPRNTTLPGFGIQSKSVPGNGQTNDMAVQQQRKELQQATRQHPPMLKQNPRESIVHSTERIVEYACPDVALFDSEMLGEFCDRRLYSATSWVSEHNDAGDYDKENQCVYRENSSPSNAEYDMGLYPSPAFSDDSLITSTSNSPASFGIQSY